MKKHIKLIVSLFMLLALASFTLIPEITLAVLGAFLAVWLNLLIFRVLRLHRGFNVTRKVERRQVTVGESIRVALKLSYNGTLPIVGGLRFRCESLGLDLDTGPLVFRPSESNTYNFSFIAKRRGAHKISPTELNLRDWLLLSERMETVTDQDEILVFPHVYPLRGDIIGVVGHRLQGLVSSGEKGRSSEIYGLREYQPFDDFKMISWKHMAKNPDQTPMTKITVGEVGPSVTVVVDVGEDMGALDGEYSNLDVAADLAASLCYNLIKSGTKTGLIFYDSRILHALRPERSARHLESILHHLALVEPSTLKFRITNLAKEYIPMELGKTFILIVGRIGDVFLDTFVNSLSKIRMYRHMILIIVHNEETRARAETFQTAAMRAGIPTFLAASGTVQHTLRLMERYAYAPTP